jgi:hypothetical protein
MEGLPSVKSTTQIQLSVYNADDNLSQIELFGEPAFQMICVVNVLQNCMKEFGFLEDKDDLELRMSQRQVSLEYANEAKQWT